MESKREDLADLMHRVWARWTAYMLALCHEPKLREGWQRQMETPYSKLSEKEKDSDRQIADEILEAIAAWNRRADNLDSFEQIAWRVFNAGFINGMSPRSNEALEDREKDFDRVWRTIKRTAAPAGKE
jgi:hypothetical protein